MQVKVNKNKEKQMLKMAARSKRAAICAAASMGGLAATYAGASYGVTHIPDSSIDPATYISQQGYHSELLNSIDVPQTRIYDSSDNQHYKTRMQITRSLRLQEEGGYKPGLSGVVQRVRIGSAMLENMLGNKGANGFVPLREHYNYVMRKPPKCSVSIDRYNTIGSYVADLGYLPVSATSFAELERNPDILKYLNEHVVGHEFAHCNGSITGINEEFRAEAASYQHIKEHYDNDAAAIALTIASAVRIVGDFNGSKDSHAMGHLFRDSLKNASQYSFEESLGHWERLNALVQSLSYEDVYERDMRHFERTYHLFKSYIGYLADQPYDPYADMMRNYVAAVENLDSYASHELLKYPDAHKTTEITNLDAVEACLNYGEINSDKNRVECSTFGL